MNVDTTTDLRHDAVTRISPELVERERLTLLRHSRMRFVHWLAVILSIVITFSVWQYSRVQVGQRTQARFDTAASQIGPLIEERLREYELALWGGVAMMRTHDNDIDLITWRNFAKNLEIERRFPGINGIGVIHQVERDEVDGYLEKQRALRPLFETHPVVEQEVAFPITFIEPVDDNIEAVGLNVRFENNRYNSLIQARDTGSAQITGPIVLIQDKGKTPGFLFFAPFYETIDHFTLASRRAQFEGAVYAPFVVKKLMDGVLDRKQRTTAIRITDQGQVIYDEISPEDLDYDKNTLGEKRIALNLYGREWQVDIRAGLNFRQANSGIETTVLFIAGMLIELLLLCMFILLSRANRRGLRFADLATAALDEEAKALQATNSELEIARTEAESVSEMKSVFLSTISHEVRTPLTAISGILVLLERADLPSKQSKLVQAGKRASENLIKLLTDVLDTSRLEANAMELWEREVAVAPLIEEWHTLGAGMVSKLGKEISVVSHMAEDTPERIVVDDIRLSQVLNNLMDNAVRFTECGEIEIRTWSEVRGDEDYLKISLSDTGIGIAAADLAIIFKRFRQVDGSVTRERGGTGLGLAISYDLVKLMHGELSVTSELGRGTTFELHIPVLGTYSKGTQIE